MSNKLSPYTLENLIDGLDERGILVIQVLIGQRAMELLAKEPTKKITKGLHAGDTGKISLTTTG